MSTDPGAPRWAPFPVQDWSSLPADEWAPAVVPRRPRRPRLPWLVTLLTLALVATAIVAADRATPATATSGVARYLPADGAVGYATRRTQDQGSDLTVPVVTEAARYQGRQVFAVLDTVLIDEVVERLGAGVATGAYVRTTTTTLDRQGPQDVELLQVGDDLRLLAESSPAGGRVYDPGLIVLPADPAPGARWSQDGRTTRGGTYRSEQRVEQEPGGCRRVIGTLTLTNSAGIAVPIEQSRTWCPGRGVQAASSVSSPEREPVRTTLTAQPAASLVAVAPSFSLTTADPTWTWRPERWTEHDYGVLSVDPQLATGPVRDAPGTADPVVTASGLVFRPGSTSRDVYAFTERDDRTWRTLWRLHPGGTVLGLSAFGDVVLVRTSLRQVVAYRGSGERLWSYDAGELVGAGPTRVDDGDIAVVSTAGRVAVLDLRTGRPRWTHELGYDVDVAPAVVGGSVVVAGQDGTVTALDAADGAERWSLAAVAPERVVPLGSDRVLVVDGTDLDAVEVASGTRVWRRPAPDTVRAVVPLGDGLVVATARRTELLGPDGRVRARLPAYRRLDLGPAVVGWGRERADVLAADGTVTTSFAVPSATLTGSWPTLPFRQGVWTFSPSWDFRGWSDEP